MSKLNNENFKGLLTPILLIVIGILFCCSISMGVNGLSILIGIILLALGLLIIINSIITSRDVLTLSSIWGVVLITLGILFMVDRLAMIIISFIPWFLIVVGSILIIDGLYSKFVKNDNNLTSLILKVVFGCISIVLGILLLTIKGFIDYASLILGIIMIVYALYLIFTNTSFKNLK